MKKNARPLYSLFFLIGIALLFASCVNERKLVYFNSIRKDSVVFVQAQALQTVIAKNDILQININTPDEATNHLLNDQLLTSTGVTGGINGYLVDEDGIVKIPQLGAVKAAGLTKNQLSSLVANDLLKKQLAKDPIVTVRIVNYRITVMGEVNRPGVIPVPNERITLPEALGQAGDLNPYANRDSLLLIRENNGKRIFKRFSMRTDQIFDKDIYNLQNQDIIYVASSKVRAESNDRSVQYISLGMSGVSLLVVLYLQLFKR